MTPDERQQRIDDYLLGTASSVERAELDANRQTDPELDRELRESQRALDAIELDGDRELKARLRQLDTQFSSTGAGAGTGGSDELGGGATIRALNSQSGDAKVVALPKRGTPSKSTTRRWLAIAAALLLLLSAGYFLLRPGGGEDSGNLLALAQRAEPYPNIAYVVTRSGTETATDPEAAAFEAYEAADYRTAAERFATLEPSPVNQFYLAQSLLAEARYPEAASVLGGLATLPDFNLAPEVNYCLGIAYLGANRLEEARPTLRAVVDTPNHPNGPDAQQLLRQLP